MPLLKVRKMISRIKLIIWRNKIEIVNTWFTLLTVKPKIFGEKKITIDALLGLLRKQKCGSKKVNPKDPKKEREKLFDTSRTQQE